MRWCVSVTIGSLLASALAAQTPAASGYLDPSACAQSHREIAENYSRTGMGRSFRSVPANAALTEFEAAPFPHAGSGQRFTPFRRDGKFYVRREAPAGRNAYDVPAD